MNIKKSSKISNGVNYNNLNKVNLREREREDTRSKRNNFQDNKIAQPIFRLAFYLKGRPKTEGLYQ